MLFSHRTRGAIAQVLTTVSSDAAVTFLYKHLGISASPPYVKHVAGADDDSLRAMATEILASYKALRLAAPIKHVFEGTVADLGRWVLHDGWLIEGGELMRVTPAAEDVTGVRDKLLQDLEASGLDGDGAIRGAIEGSSKDFVGHPPDFNGSTTKVRIALETIARRAAPQLAAKYGHQPVTDTWGHALLLIRTVGAIEKTEEEMLARVYTFVSPGAHVPKGLTEEEWARLSRTFVLSSAYFLLQKYSAA